MRDSDTVTTMRRDLGRQLAAHRSAAGYLQRELGVMVGYSRTAIANAETGSARIGRQLWAGADRVLRTGELFACGYDRIQAQIAAETHARRQVPPAAPAADPAPGDLASPSISQARQACQDRGWPACQDSGGRLWLVTGTTIDALEVPQLAGMAAMGWWLYTRGVPDAIRGLPALPDPATALAVITTGTRCYFLARSGACPWTPGDTTPRQPAGQSAGAEVVAWHATGGRVPAPPSPLEGGGRASWAHAPDTSGQLPSPMALLHLLAHATATTKHGGMLALPGGVHAVPAIPGAGIVPASSHLGTADGIACGNHDKPHC